MRAANTKNQCFAILENELEGRLDSHFYKSEFTLLKNELQKTNHKLLGNIISFSDETWNQEDIFDNKFPYIEISEIDIITGEIKNIIYYDKNKAPSRAKMIVRKNDIIVSTTRPNRGAISFIDKSKDGFIASTGFAVLRNLKIKDISKEYLFYFLKTNLALNQMLQRSSGGNYPAITIEELQKIVISIPSLQVQNQIVEIMDSAYNQRREKEKEAENLLNSIDNYFLNELDIKTPEIKDKMCFVVNSKNLSNNRVDAIYWKPRFQIIEKILKNGQFPIKGLTEIAKIQRGILISPKKYKMGKQSYIRIADLKNLEIDPSEVMKVDFEDNKGKVFENEILFTAIGATIGKMALIDSRFAGAYFSNNLTKIIPIKVNSIYLIVFLLGRLGQEQIKRYSTQTAQPKINDKELARIQIPLPPFEIQDKIVNETKSRLEKAKKLKLEAKNVVEEAKKEVEMNILGK